MYNKLNPTFKLILLIITIFLIFFLDTKIQFLLFFITAIVLCIFTKTPVFKGYKFLYLGIFISIFTYLSQYAISENINTSIIEAMRVLGVFILIYIFSYIYKTNTSNVEVSYALSNILNIFRPLGYNQNKMYTTILVILNTIYSLFDQVKNMYFYERRIYPKKISKLKTTKIVFELIAPFFNKVLFKNEIYTLALITKDFNLNTKNIRYYTQEEYSPFSIFIYANLQVVLVLIVIL